MLSLSDHVKSRSTVYKLSQRLERNGVLFPHTLVTVHFISLCLVFFHILTSVRCKLPLNTSVEIDNSARPAPAILLKSCRIHGCSLSSQNNRSSSQLGIRDAVLSDPRCCSFLLSFTGMECVLTSPLHVLACSNNPELHCDEENSVFSYKTENS